MNVKRASFGFILGRTAYHLVMVVTQAGSRRRQATASKRPSTMNQTVEGNPTEAQQDDFVPPNPNDPWKFFGLLFVLSIPFLIFGGKPLPIPIDLPFSALMAFNPFIAAAILTYPKDGFEGIKALIKRVFDFRRIRNRYWLIPTLLLIPSIYLLSYGVMRLTGAPLPDPEIPFQIAPLLFGLFFITAAGEELGWTGYAIEPLQNRWGAFRAALIVGLVWALWHIIPDVQIGHPSHWVFWQRIYSIALRILIVWMYNNTGKSVFAAIVIHATDNVSWTLFPNLGSHYNPLFTGLITSLLAAIVVAGWGSKTLARFKFAGARTG